MFIRQHHRNTDNISQIEGHYEIIGITINTCKHKQNHFFFLNDRQIFYRNVYTVKKKINK